MGIFSKKNKENNKVSEEKKLVLCTDPKKLD